MQLILKLELTICKCGKEKKPLHNLECEYLEE